METAPEVILPLISGLVGALVGSLSSVLVVLIQSRKDEQKQLRDMALQLALTERGEQLAILKERGTGSIYPASLYLAYHMKLAKLVTKNRVSARSLKRLQQDMDKLKAGLDEIEAERRSKNST